MFKFPKLSSKDFKKFFNKDILRLTLKTESRQIPHMPVDSVNL